MKIDKCAVPVTRFHRTASGNSGRTISLPNLLHVRTNLTARWTNGDLARRRHGRRKIQNSHRFPESPRSPTNFAVVPRTLTLETLQTLAAGRPSDESSSLGKGRDARPRQARSHCVAELAGDGGTIPGVLKRLSPSDSGSTGSRNGPRNVIERRI